MRTFYLFCLIIYAPFVKGQSKNACAAFSYFLNSKEVVSSFKSVPKKDSILYLIDKENALKKCEISVWLDRKVKILHDSIISRDLIKHDAHYLYPTRCDYYVFTFQTEGNKYVFSVVNACSNMDSYGKLKKVKNGFSILEFKKSVF